MRFPIVGHIRRSVPGTAPAYVTRVKEALYSALSDRRGHPIYRPDGVIAYARGAEKFINYLDVLSLFRTGEIRVRPEGAAISIDLVFFPTREFVGIFVFFSIVFFVYSFWRFPFLFSTVYLVIHIIVCWGVVARNRRILLRWLAEVVDGALADPDLASEVQVRGGI